MAQVQVKRQDVVEMNQSCEWIIYMQNWMLRWTNLIYRPLLEVWTDSKIIFQYATTYINKIFCPKAYKKVPKYVKNFVFYKRPQKWRKAFKILPKVAKFYQILSQ